MPNKTIYVSDEDLPLFEHAQELTGDSLSAVIVHALRRFIELEAAKQRGLEEITVIVNTAGAHRRKRFLGTRLARWLQATPDGKGIEILNVYHTAGNRYALHTRSIPDWKLSWGDPEYIENSNNSWWPGDGILQKLTGLGVNWGAVTGEAGNFTLEVLDTLEELKPHVSNDLYQAVSQSMGGPDIEDLDI